MEAARRKAFGPDGVRGLYPVTPDESDTSLLLAKVRAAHAAQQAAASHVAFGGYFPYSVKPAALASPLQILRNTKATITIPAVAIGGITLQNAPQQLAVSADAIAVIAALFAAVNAEATARLFAQMSAPAQ